MKFIDAGKLKSSINEIFINHCMKSFDIDQLRQIQKEINNVIDCFANLGVWVNAIKNPPKNTDDVIVCLKNEGGGVTTYEISIDNYINNRWLDGDGRLGRTTIFWLQLPELPDSIKAINML